MTRDHCDCGKHCARRPAPRVDVIAEVEASMKRMIERQRREIIEAFEARRG